MQAGGGENQDPTKLDSPIRPSVKHIIYSRVSHITPIFELSYTLLTTHAHGLYEFIKKNFSVIDHKLKFRERFSFLHFLQGKNAFWPKVPIFGQKKMALRVAKSKF